MINTRLQRLVHLGLVSVVIGWMMPDKSYAIECGATCQQYAPHLSGCVDLSAPHCSFQNSFICSGHRSIPNRRTPAEIITSINEICRAHLAVDQHRFDRKAKRERVARTIGDLAVIVDQWRAALSELCSSPATEERQSLCVSNTFAAYSVLLSFQEILWAMKMDADQAEDILLSAEAGLSWAKIDSVLREIRGKYGL